MPRPGSRWHLRSWRNTQGKVEELEEARRSIPGRSGQAMEAKQSRLEAQLQVLQEAEELLAGYAEGARFLLDAVRQSRLRGNGALSAALDVPPELEIAIGAALGDIVDAVLVDEIRMSRRHCACSNSKRRARSPAAAQWPL